MYVKTEMTKTLLSTKEKRVFHERKSDFSPRNFDHHTSLTLTKCYKSHHALATMSSYL